METQWKHEVSYIAVHGYRPSTHRRDSLAPWGLGAGNGWSARDPAVGSV